MSRRHRVVVVGAGFGGLAVARHLADAPVDVVVVDANNFHTFQPLLYQVATAGLNSEDIAAAVRGIFHRQRNVDFRMGRVVGADLEAHTVRFDDGDELGYDHLVLAAGGVTNTYGIPGVREHAHGLKTLEDALAVRSHVLRQFERAADEPGLVDDGALTVVIGGGGPTGVELAGAMLELFTMVLARDYPHLDVRRARVVLVEAGDRVLAGFSQKSSDRARRTLTARGVELVLGVGVDKFDGHAVHLADGRRIPTTTLVWTAGITASPLATVLGVATGRGGRLPVEPDLTLVGHRDVLVVGDLAGSTDADGHLLPQVAQVAIQGGRHAAATIGRQLEGRTNKPFRYRDHGSMATIGRRDAVAELPGGLRLFGEVGWLAWLGLHLIYLIGFRNKANVLLNWAWNYLTYDRGSRLLFEREGDSPGQ